MLQFSYFQTVQILIALIVIDNVVQSEFENSCKTYSGKPGECVNVFDCPETVNYLLKNVIVNKCDSGKFNDTFTCCDLKQERGIFKIPINQKKCIQYQSRKKVKIFLNDFRYSSRIHVIGGIDTLEKEYPHMAALGYGSDLKNVIWLCGGSLISRNFILTAAHCTNTKNFGNVKFARLGTLNLEAKPKSLQDFTILEFYQHPEYVPPSYYNDIALLKLDRDVSFNEYVHPACLYSFNQDLPLNRNPTATGWGETEFRGSKSFELQKVQLTYFTYEECKKEYEKVSKTKLPNGIHQLSHLCAGSKDEKKDTCQGDSGGPLQIKFDPFGENALHFLVGITSFGKLCGLPNVPSVYTRVSHFVPWIEKVVWLEDD